MLRVSIVTDAEPRLAWRLAERVKNEVPGASICGLVYQPRTKLPDSLIARVRNWSTSAGDFLLRLAHASLLTRSLPHSFTPDDMLKRAAAMGWRVKLCDKLNSKDVSDFVLSVSPDLCLLWIDPVLASGLAIHSAPAIRVTLDRATSGPNSHEIAIQVLHTDGGNASPSAICTAHLPVEAYDTTVSQKLKSDLISTDLLVQSVAMVAHGETMQRPVRAEHLLPHLRYWHQRTTGNGNAAPPALRTRPRWKLCVASMLLAPYVVARNWYRRLRSRFPVTILFHHLISDVPHHLGMPTDAFLRAVNFLAKHYRIVSLSEAVDLLESGKVKEPTVVLTFDDGYQENFITLRAVTEATGIPVACFVCTQLAEKQDELDHDVRRNERNFLSMNWDQIEYLSRNGVEIGSHTRTHRDCGTNDKSVLRNEIAGAKVDMEQHLASVRFFAFPFGKQENMSAEALALAARQYDYSFSGLGGDNFPDSHRTSRHLSREGLREDVWELELTLQAVLGLKKGLKARLVFDKGATVSPLSSKAATYD